MLDCEDTWDKEVLADTRKWHFVLGAHDEEEVFAIANDGVGTLSFVFGPCLRSQRSWSLSDSRRAFQGLSLYRMLTHT